MSILSLIDALESEPIPTEAISMSRGRPVYRGSRNRHAMPGLVMCARLTELFVAWLPAFFLLLRLYPHGFGMYLNQYGLPPRSSSVI